MKQLLETHRRYEQKISTSVSLRALARNWRELKEKSFSMSRLESEQVHREMSSRLRELVAAETPAFPSAPTLPTSVIRIRRRRRESAGDRYQHGS